MLTVPVLNAADGHPVPELVLMLMLMGPEDAVASAPPPWGPCARVRARVSTAHCALLVHTRCVQTWGVHACSSGRLRVAAVAPPPPQGLKSNQFPLYSEAIKFFQHPETMVRTAVRTITLKVYRGAYACPLRRVSLTRACASLAPLVERPAHRRATRSAHNNATLPNATHNEQATTP